MDGQDYYFVGEKTFRSMVESDDFLEYARVFGHLYGTPSRAVYESLAKGNDILFDIDWQGGQQVRESSLGKHTLSIFILPPSIAELERRLIKRAQDNPEVIERRMKESRDEISHWPEYDYVLVNDDLDATEEKLRTILSAERLRRSQQPGLVDVVRNLNSEFEDRRT